MARILFISEAMTLTHVVRSHVLGSHLAQQGDAVTLAAGKYFDRLFKTFPGERRDLRSSRHPADFRTILGKGGVIFDYEVLSGFLSEELQLFKELKPDLVVGDLRPSLAVSTRLAALPLITITNAYWSRHLRGQYFPPPCLDAVAGLNLGRLGGPAVLMALKLLNAAILPGVLKAQGAGLNRLRLEHRLDPFEHYLDGFTFGDEICFTDAQELFPLQNAPANHNFIGPISWSPSVNLPPWWEEVRTRRPLIYVNLGSSGDARALALVLDTLAGFDCTVAAASSGTPLKLGRSSNIHLADYLPGDEILKSATLAICNGGSPACYQALSKGVPIIAIPTNMDQLLFSHCLQKHGFGISLRSDTLRPSQIRSAISRLLRNGARDRYRTLAAHLSACEPERQFQRIAQRLLSSSTLTAPENSEEWRKQHAG